MAATIYPTVPVAQPEAEPWPDDEHSIRVDEMFARQLDTEFSAGVRDLLHAPETGLSALKGEAALEAIAGAMPALVELKDRTLAQAIGPRQRSLLEPMIETRLDWAAGTIGRLAHRATVEVDDQSVADRLAGLGRDAATAWRDPAHLRKLGRTAVTELRYQGERRGWDAAETDAKARGSLSDLYAGAVEAAIGQNDFNGAAALYDHARPVIDSERQATIDKRFARAREVAVFRNIDRELADLPLDPAGPPALDIFERRAAELVPEDASDAMRAGIAQVADHAHRHAERQWRRRQADAGLAALEWFRKNPEGSLLAIPMEVRDWLAPDQWRGLEDLYVKGRLATDGDLFERLDRQMVHEPDTFAAVDLDRHRLSLGDADYTRFAAAQKAIAEGRIDPDLARYDRLRLGIDGAFEALDIDADSPVAIKVRADARNELTTFEIIEGRPPNGEDIDDIVAEVIERTVGEDPPPTRVPDGAFDPGNIILAGNPPPGGGSRGGGGGGSGRGPQTPPAATPQQRPAPVPGSNQPPREIQDGFPTAVDKVLRWLRPPVQPPATSAPPNAAGPRAAAEQGAEPSPELPKSTAKSPRATEDRVNTPSDFWPDNNGFAGEPKKVTLTPGTVVDRYGGPGGSYLSPKGTPPEARSLSPGAEARPLNVYEVIKPFEVDAGAAAPHFNQPGGGTQYYLGTRRTVQDLIDSGHLRKLP